MKNMKLIILGIMMVGVMLASSQQTEAIRADTSQRWQEMAELAETSAIANANGIKFAAAADYLKLALVLGLGMLIGRMSAISCRELTELKMILIRLANHSPVTANEIKGLDTCRQGETKN